MAGSLLLEDGSYLLLEDGGRVLLDTGPPPGLGSAGERQALFEKYVGMDFRTRQSQKGKQWQTQKYQS